MLEAEELACPSESGLDLVGDQHDAVALGDLAQGREERYRGLQEFPVALHRFDNDRGDAVRSDFGREDLVQSFERALGRHVARGVREGVW